MHIFEIEYQFNSVTLLLYYYRIGGGAGAGSERVYLVVINGLQNGKQ